MTATRFDDDLEQSQCDPFWLPPFVTVVDRPDAHYRHAAKNDSLYNQVVRVAQHADVPALIAEVQPLYDGRKSRWQLAAPSLRDDLIQGLEEAGYRQANVHDAYAFRVDRPRPRPPAGITVRPVASRQQLEDLIAVQNAAFGRAVTHSQAEWDQMVQECTKPEARVHRFVAYDDRTGQPISCGGMNSHSTQAIGFLWGGGTHPDARGRGAYSALVTARIKHAGSLGIEAVGVYARRTTSAPILEAQGFEKHGPMLFIERDCQAHF